MSYPLKRASERSKNAVFYSRASELNGQSPYLKQAYAGSNVHAYVHSYPRAIPRKVKRRAKAANPFRMLASFIFLGFVVWYVLPCTYAAFFEPMFLNRYLNRNIKPDARLLVSPTLGYLANDNLFSQNILVPSTSHKGQGLLTPITSAGENVALKNKLSALSAKYPRLKPSIYIWDYATGQSVEINSDAPISTASIIKLPVLFELFRQMEKKDHGFGGDLHTKIKFDEFYRTSGSGDMQYKAKADNQYSIDYLANVMITKSDNSATNILLDTIGGKSGLNRAFHAWGLERSYVSGWLPDLNGTNRMSAKDISTLLYNLDNPNFLNHRSKEIIKEYLSNVENRTLLEAGLPNDALLLHKTGDIGSMLGDAGIVYRADGRKYIITVLVKRPHNDYSARDFIKEVSSVVYKGI